jgi:hypothetical protein
MPIAAKVDEALVEALSSEQRELFEACLQKVVARQAPREAVRVMDTQAEVRPS